MQETSNLYKQLLAEDGHTFEIQLLVGESGSETIIGMDHIDAMRRIGAFSETGGLTVGACPSQRLEVTLRGVVNSSIPRMGRLRPQIRVVGADEETFSEWIDLGIFFVDNRQVDIAGGVIEITAYDAMLKGDSILMPSEVKKQGTSIYVTGDGRIYTHILMRVAAQTIGSTFDETSRNYFGLHEVYVKDEVDVVRSTISRIAGCIAANALISASGLLRFVRVNNSAAVADINEDDVSVLGETLPAVTHVVLQDSRKDSDGDIWTVEAGDNTGSTIYVEGTKYLGSTNTQAQSILLYTKNVVYTPMIAQDVFLDPALELGDVVSTGNTTWMIYSMDVEYGRLVVGTISAPAPYEMEHEFPSRPAGELTAEAALREARSAQNGLGYCPEIPSGADLDSYTTPGVFAAASNSVAATLSHCPSTLGGRLTVVSALGSWYTDSSQWIYLRQLYETYNGLVYHRHGISSSGFSGLAWSDWSLIYGVDAVTEQGTSGNWRYKKFASGDAVLWGIHDVSPTTSTQTGSMYYTESLEVSTPFSLVDQVVINATPATHVCFATNVYYSAARSAVGFRLVRNAVFDTNSAVTVHLQVWGKWK